MPKCTRTYATMAQPLCLCAVQGSSLDRPLVMLKAGDSATAKQHVDVLQRLSGATSDRRAAGPRDVGSEGAVSGATSSLLRAHSAMAALALVRISHPFSYEHGITASRGHAGVEQTHNRDLQRHVGAVMRTLQERLFVCRSHRAWHLHVKHWVLDLSKQT